VRTPEEGLSSRCRLLACEVVELAVVLCPRRVEQAVMRASSDIGLAVWAQGPKALCFGEPVATGPYAVVR